MSADELAVTLEKGISLGKNEQTQTEGVALLEKMVTEATTTHMPTGSIPKVYEKATAALSSIYSSTSNSYALQALLSSIKPWFAVLPKVRTHKLVLLILRAVAKCNDSNEQQISIIHEMTEWAKNQKHPLLVQALAIHNATLLYISSRYHDALKETTQLIKQVKKLDDKSLQVEIQLLESRVHLSLQNIPRAKAALTAARTAANAVYCPPLVQASIDMQGGILHASNADFEDFKNAYSYFYEAFEAYSLQDELKEAMRALKYMLLCKIMMGKSDEIDQLLTNKLALQFAGPEIDAMKAIGNAAKERSLEILESAQKEFKENVDGDPVVKMHLNSLYNSLLSTNLLRIIEPYSSVELSFIADQIKLPLNAVEKQLSLMILDGIVSGVLDQQKGTLEIFDEVGEHQAFDNALESIGQMNKVVTSLFETAAALN